MDEYEFVVCHWNPISVLCFGTEELGQRLYGQEKSCDRNVLQIGFPETSNSDCMSQYAIAGISC